MSGNTELPKYLTEKQVSELTGVAVQTLRNWRCDGKGPRYVRPGGRLIRYPYASVIDFMESSAVQTQPCPCRRPEAGRVQA